MAQQDFLALAPRPKGSPLLNVVVETPGGSRNKFKFDPERRLFQLDKILPAGAAFPFDFGFVPSTLGDDGDPLDVVVLADEPTFTGCVLTVRLLGVLEAKQIEKGKTIRNDRLIGMVETRKNPSDAQTLSDVPPRLLREIEHFFVSYNKAEGREFVPLRRGGPGVAEKLIEDGIRRFKRTPKSKGGS